MLHTTSAVTCKTRRELIDSYYVFICLDGRVRSLNIRGSRSRSPSPPEFGSSEDKSRTTRRSRRATSPIIITEVPSTDHTYRYCFLLFLRLFHQLYHTAERRAGVANEIDEYVCTCIMCLSHSAS